MMNQLSIWDCIGEQNPNEPIKPPNWDDQKELFKKSKTIGEILDKIPKYLVTFKKPIQGGYIKKVCVYLGYWHTVDGWNLRKEEVDLIESWEEYKWESGMKCHWNK